MVRAGLSGGVEWGGDGGVSRAGGYGQLVCRVGEAGRTRIGASCGAGKVCRVG